MSPLLKVLAAIWVVLGLGGLAWAGDPPAEATTDTNAAAPLVLGPASMSVESTQLDQLIVAIRLRSEPPSAVQDIVAGLDADEAAMTLAATETRGRLDAPDAAAEMHDARATWSITVDLLDREQRELADYASRLAADLVSLEAAQERWSAGRAALPADAPPSLVTQADNAMQGIEAARQEVNARNHDALQAVQRVASLHATASAVLDDVDQAVRDVLFSRDSAPLWSLPNQVGVGDVGPVVVAGARRRAQDIATYVSGSPWRVVFPVFCALLAAWLFLRARRLPDEWLPARTHLSWRALVERPMSSAILLSLGAGTLLHLRAPSAFLDILVALAILPLVRVLRVLIPGAALKPMYLLFGVYVVNRSVALLAGAGTLYRVSLVAADLLALVATAWALRELARRAALADSSSERALRWLLLMAVAASVTALVANVVGFVALATVIIDGSLESLYIAAVLWTTVMLLEGCIRFAAVLPAAQRLGIVRNHEDYVENRLGQLLRLGGALAWGGSMVYLLSLGQPLSDALRQVLAVGLTVGNIDLVFGDVLAFAVSMWLAVSVSRLLRFVLDEDVLPRMDLPKGVPATVLTLTHYGVVGAGLFIALAAAGANLEQFAFAAGALGIGIGFGLQGITNNLVSGLILLFERPIQVGDIIELGTLTGRVQHIGMRACRVRTLDGAEVIVPNADLVTDPVVNWTLSDRVRRFDVEIGVAYGSRPEEVIALLQEVVQGTPGVLANPAPETLLDDFGASSVDFLIRAWAPYDEYLATRSATRVRIEAALREAGIEIPFPQRDLHLRSIDAVALATLNTDSPPASGDREPVDGGPSPSEDRPENGSHPGGNVPAQRVGAERSARD